MPDPIEIRIPLADYERARHGADLLARARTAARAQARAAGNTLAEGYATRWADGVHGASDLIVTFDVVPLNG